MMHYEDVTNLVFLSVGKKNSLIEHKMLKIFGAELCQVQAQQGWHAEATTKMEVVIHLL